MFDKKLKNKLRIDSRNGGLWGAVGIIFDCYGRYSASV